MQHPTDLQIYTILAAALAAKSTCSEWEGGAVIVKDGMIAGMGWAASPPGEPPCDEEHGHDNEPVRRLVDDSTGVGGKRWAEFTICRRPIHPPVTAILQAARSGRAIDGASMICTEVPCMDCARMIAAVGIVNLYAMRHRTEYRGVSEWLDAHGVAVEMIELQGSTGEQV